jgi:hypothetical protein
MESNFQDTPDELVDLDLQIQKTVQDLGRISSFSQNNDGDALSKLRQEKMQALRELREKRIDILKNRHS